MPKIYSTLNLSTNYKLDCNVAGGTQQKTMLTDRCHLHVANRSLRRRWNHANKIRSPVKSLLMTLGARYYHMTIYP